MKNALMARLLGESDDVVPVIANTPRAVLRSRSLRDGRPSAKEADDDASSSVRRMVGEGTEKPPVIPDDAEPMDTVDTMLGKPLRPVKEIVQEPSHPADKEKFQTPYAALTAPDVTPQATQPIDPSSVPGATGPEKFTASDLERAPDGEEMPSGASAETAMNVLLGRGRASKAPTQPGEFEQAGAITTEEAAAAALGIVTPLQEAAAVRAANVLVSAIDGGGGMPSPAPASDGKAVCDAFRRFKG